MPKKPDPRRIKSHRVYTVRGRRGPSAAPPDGPALDQVGETQADRTWKPWLVEGAVLKAFLGHRRQSGKCRLALAQFYCLGCRAARTPDGRLAELILTRHGAGTLMGFCPECGAAMHKAVRRADLELIRAQLDVHIRTAQPRIVGSTDAPVTVDMPKEVRTRATQRIG